MIVVSELTKRYRGVNAIDRISFTLDTGVTGLLGPNGAGKTTLLRCMLGIVKPTGGSVVLDGGSAQRSVGYLPQRFGLFRELTVAESMRYFAALKRIDRQQLHLEIPTCLRVVGLDDRLEHPVRTLSGGMLRRLGIATALLGQPQVLLFDEPTSGLDPEERVRFKRLISELGETRAVLVSTHIVADVEDVASRVVVLHEGRLLATGTIEEVVQAAEGRCFTVPRELVSEKSPDYYVDGYSLLEGRSQARVMSSHPHDGFIETRPTLEDGYLCLIRGLACLRQR